MGMTDGSTIERTPPLPHRFSLDPADTALLADPYPTFALLRENDPVRWSELGFWVVSRCEDVRGVVMTRTDFGQGDFIRNIQPY